MNILKRI